MMTVTSFASTLVLFITMSSERCSAAAADTLTPAQSLRDGDTIVSATELFELGFFSPGDPHKRYVGIWYKKISPLTVVWVANREAPAFDSSGSLNLTGHGNLILQDRTQGIIWSSNSATDASADPVAQLLDSGNFVVRGKKGGNPEENSPWQSFDHLCDTLLPGTKLGIDPALPNITGQKQLYLSSWKSLDNPSPGDFRLGIDPARFRQLLVTQIFTARARTGPWNGLQFSGVSGIRKSSFLKYDFVSNPKEMYWRYEVTKTSLITRFVLNESGVPQRYVWEDRQQSWQLYRAAPSDTCFRYGACGTYGICDDNLQSCVCMEGFTPKSPKAWDLTDWESGCVRKTPLQCGNGDDGFLNISGAKLPDTKDYWYNGSMSLEECRLECLNNCSCRAYANPYITGKNGCLMWFSDLMNSMITNDNSDSFFVRMAASELDKYGGGKRGKSGGKKRVKILVSSVGVFTILLLLGLVIVLRLRRKKMQRQQQEQRKMEYIMGRDHTTKKENLDLPVIDLATIKNATDNFSSRNILGKGGFGPVYKGVLKDGQEIAVKRLSRSSKQGLDEFKNEVIHITKLQHRNLVKLLGCYIKGDEKILVYEFMPNKSLDFHIFDKTKSKMLDWPTRFSIINGVARGILYLHQDSRLRIIHRDLKAGNILLDNEMNPKISDFGLARSFLGNEDEANTKQVVGTCGYMSPEYAIDGIYSTKSDVFSFGVLSLEIVSNKKNRGFIHPDHNLNLLGHAWKLHRENQSLELFDASMDTTTLLGNYVEVMRSIHMGLLCVQRNPEDRPNMSFVVQMLSSDDTLPPPKQPGFFTGRDLDEARPSSTGNNGPFTPNEMSATTLGPR